jgi:PilZ domain
MNLKIEGIFMPSVGVDLVFNMNSLTPVSRSSIIHDADFQRKTLTIAQPLIPITSKTAFDRLDLTTIITRGQNRIRVGIECQPITFVNQYRLANQMMSEAVVVRYKLPVEETNIRTAFRLPLSQRYTIRAKMIYEGGDYYTPNDFRIRDISFTGTGILIPKKKSSRATPLMGLNKKDIVPLGLVLTDEEKEKPVGAFPLRAEIIRVNKNYSDSHVLVGLKILDLDEKNETVLNRFIHTAQIDQLNKFSVRRD